jgi:DNA-binding response OmpR family regulator
MAANCPLLLVDDDEDIREAVRMMLEDEGYEVIEARDGREALEWLRSHPPPAVMLLDWNMAPMNGAQLVAEVSKEARLAELPIVVLTADTTALRTVQDAHYAGWLKKPFQIDELFDVVRRYCT